ncbi:BspA family leucine-rich repeat surface protein [Bombilactobacillus folatiphilus]|uniref:BspA family leucine-rich repeat surface protein n=2 Tax=Bombilactobacillus folatiphilus TaxID=2923362 RepID=A0ABY4P8C6_9LACO|nr:BspA family leucine-rich repeat surface protein [Bombilactobacillus folatiphilus]
MFSFCVKLKSLDLSDFDTSNVNIMISMFHYCSSLSNLNLSSFNTSKVTNMRYMFDGCSSLNSLDLSSFDTSLGSQLYLNNDPHLSHIVAYPNLQLVLNSDDRTGKTMPGNNQKVVSNDWVATNGYQSHRKYTADQLSKLKGRDQVTTTYEWDFGQVTADQTVEKKAVTRTINVYQPDGIVQATTQTAVIQRTVKYNDDGTETYGDWSTA